MMMMIWPLSSNDKKKKKMGLACISKERRTEIARMGGLARARQWREQREERKKMAVVQNYTLTDYL